jgi:RNA-binding protein
MVMNLRKYMEPGDRIKTAGKVVNFSNKGNIILRGRDAPRIGSLIVDKRSNKIGKLIRITGPVSSPYLILSPRTDDPDLLRNILGKDLYISERNERERDRYRNKPNIKGRNPKRVHAGGKTGWKDHSSKDHGRKVNDRSRRKRRNDRQ